MDNDFVGFELIDELIELINDTILGRVSIMWVMLSFLATLMTLMILVPYIFNILKDVWGFLQRGQLLRAAASAINLMGMRNLVYLGIILKIMCYLSRHGINDWDNFVQHGDLQEFDMDVDSQNVHDSHVTKSLRASVQRLRRLESMNLSESTVSKCLGEIRESFRTNESREVLCRVLDSIEERNTRIICIDMTEIEVLCMVWRRIHHPDNDGMRKTLIENFHVQLLDCEISRDNLYCSQGTVTRIIQSLEKCDHDNVVSLKPRWYFKQRTQDLMGWMRDKIFDRLSEHAKKNYGNDDELTKRINHTISKNVRNKLHREFKGKVDEEEINATVQDMSMYL